MPSASRRPRRSPISCARSSEGLSAAHPTSACGGRPHPRGLAGPVVATDVAGSDAHCPSHYVPVLERIAAGADPREEAVEDVFPCRATRRRGLLFLLKVVGQSMMTPDLRRRLGGHP